MSRYLEMIFYVSQLEETDDILSNSRVRIHECKIVVSGMSRFALGIVSRLKAVGTLFWLGFIMGPVSEEGGQNNLGYSN